MASKMKRKTPTQLDAEIDAAIGKRKPSYRKPLSIQLIDPNPEKIWPWNEAFDTARTERIADSMRENGWQGDPLVIVEAGAGRGTYRALTGSHRLDAAAQTNTKVPVVILRLPPGWKCTWEGLFRNGRLMSEAPDVVDGLVEDGVDPRIIPLLDS